MTVEIEATVTEVAVTFDIKSAARTILPIAFCSSTTPDIQIALPSFVNVVVATCNILCQFLNTCRNVIKEFAGISICRKLESRLDGTTSRSITGCSTSIELYTHLRLRSIETHVINDIALGINDGGIKRSGILWTSNRCNHLLTSLNRTLIERSYRISKRVG